MDLNSVYQELILKHYRRPNNRGKLEDADVEIHRLNPTCGDDITLQLRVRDDRIESARFHGEGCAISQASASMMTQLLEGKSLAEADALTARFLEMMHGSEEAARDKELGDLRALAGVSKLPVRVRCAVLAWDALQEAEKKVRGGG
jgi:nitrogen fixation protein NifU and related proteins